MSTSNTVILDRRSLLTGLTAVAVSLGLPAPPAGAVDTFALSDGYPTLEQIVAELMRVFTKIYGSAPTPGAADHELICVMARGIFDVQEATRLMIENFQLQGMMR